MNSARSNFEGTLDFTASIEAKESTGQFVTMMLGRVFSSTDQKHLLLEDADCRFLPWFTLVCYNQVTQVRETN